MGIRFSFSAGTLPVLYLSWVGVRHMKPLTTLEEPRDVLFTEIVK
jgi:hypothetical protein